MSEFWHSSQQSFHDIFEWYKNNSVIMLSDSIFSLKYFPLLQKKSYSFFEASSSNFLLAINELLLVNTSRWVLISSPAVNLYPASRSAFIAYFRALRTSRNKAHHLVLGCLTGEGVYIITNLGLSAFKTNQWNRSQKSYGQIYQLPIPSIRIGCCASHTIPT